MSLHVQRACRLYRHSLKAAVSWCVQRELFYAEARKLRAEFEANRHLDRVQGERLVAKGEERLAGTAHPDPYIVPYYTGGSLYARNPEVPADVKIHLDFGREGYDQS